MDLSTWARPACAARLGGSRPPSDPLASWFGRILVSLPGEGWPGTEGAPMLPVAQFNLREVPSELPRGLEGVAMLTLFVGPWELPVDEPNGVNWELRAYESVDRLVRLEAPAPARAEDPKARKGEPSTLRAFPIHWEEREDLPCRDCVPVEFADAWDEWAGTADSTDLTFDGTKLGGWPYCLQGEVRWSSRGRLIGDCEFVLQISSDERAGLSWGYDGIAYVGREPQAGPEGWHLSWQSL